MPFFNAQLLCTLVVVMAGVACYLRLVAKEIRRRERYLLVRHDEMVKQEAEAKGGGAEEGVALDSPGGPDVEGEPVRIATPMPDRPGRMTRAA
jgi:hypothetical protein